MGDQGAEYASFVQAELKHEYDRRDVVNSRAGTAIATASGLVTVTLAVVALAKGQSVTLGGVALVSLLVALFAFLASGVLAVLAGLNWRFKVTSIGTLHTMLADHWIDSETTARNQSATCNLQTINSLRAGTNIKTRFLLGAAFAQIAAILGLSVCVLFVVI
ncbi:hypothetical protein [Fodinicola acaciae]|uniref:hypothetical protein n=1 Tax=Fodinicola acaciae TaxID=2681555 RepID=UPI0013D3FC84|nr:hypothetical protein [Fodinicola acaciae]